MSPAKSSPRHFWARGASRRDASTTTHLDSCRTACSPDAATPLQPSPPSALRSPPTARQTSPLAPASNARGRACRDAPPRLSARRRVLHSHSPPRLHSHSRRLCLSRLLAAHASLQPAPQSLPRPLHLPPRLSPPRRRACTRRRLSAQAAQASTRRCLATVLCRSYCQSGIVLGVPGPVVV